MYGQRGPLDRRGALPFAVIAITVVIVAASWAVVAYGIQRSNDSSDDVDDTRNAVDTAAEHVSAWVERGLGEIIADVSTNGTGTLEERERVFQDRTREWMEDMFPATDSGLTVTVKGWDVELTSRLLHMDGILSLRGYTPAYLTANGTVDAVFESTDGRASRPLDVTADAGSALPLAAERGSLFTNALKGDGSILSQLMTYQLSCLAQYRVVNGYGALSYYGGSGTYDVLTKEDVRDSYESCVSAVSSLYLRNGDGEWCGNVDAASELIGREKVRIDLNSVYAQALYGVVDDIVAKWLDYFGGVRFLSDLDNVADALVTGWDRLVGFLTGRDTDSAEGYIRSVCGDAPYVIGTDQWFTFDNGEDAYTIPYETIDVLNTTAVKKFNSTYRGSTNGIQDWIAGIVNRAVASIAEQKSLGTVEFEINKDADFTEAFSREALSAVERCMSGLSESLMVALRSVDYNDRFSEAIWHQIDDLKDEDFFYTYDDFVRAYLDVVNDVIWESGEEDPENLLSLEELWENPSTRAAHAKWVSLVDATMEGLHPLCEVASRNSDILRDGCSFIIAQGLNLSTIGVDLAPAMRHVCGEYAAGMSAAGYSGIYEFPTGSGFTLVRDGEETEVTLDLELHTDPVIDVRIDRANCTHGTSLTERDVASYTTAWRITLRDDVRVAVHTRDVVSEAVSDDSSVFRDGFRVTLDLPVTAVSGWALTGVEYTATNTATSDLENLFLGFLLELVDPMMDLMKSLQEVIALISETVSKLGGIAEEAVERLFTLMNSPVMKFQERIDSVLSDMGCRTFLELVKQLERSYHITLSSQTFTLSYGGWSLANTLYLGTLDSATKHLVKSTLSGEVGGASFSITLDFKIKGTSTFTPVVTGAFSCSGKDWDLAGDVDPVMSSHDHIIFLKGRVRETAFEVTTPVLHQYKEVDLSLCDVGGLGTVLSNIPFVIPGTLVSLDAGIDVKYDAPVTGGVIINEVEANPAGDDRDSEWAEILNLSLAPVDLSGWTLETSKKKTYTFPEGTELSVGERTVVEFEGMFLNNTDESLTLRNSDGDTVEKVSLKNDTFNDGRTCQRGIDGLTHWGLYEGTPGERNHGGLFGTDGTVTKRCYEIVAESAKKALGDLGGKVVTEEGLAQLVYLTMKYSLDKGIDELSSCLIEASLYIEVEFTDVTSSVTLLGFRVHLSADKVLAGDVLRYLVGNAVEMVFGIKDPYNISLKDAFMDDTMLGVTFYTAYGLPSVLDPSGDGDVLLGVDVAVNLSGLSTVIGRDGGNPRIEAGVLARNVPYSALPKFMDAQKHRTNDLWLMTLALYPYKEEKGL